MVVYVDLLMLLNFAVDFLLLLGTNRLAGYPPGIRRAALAAAAGGLYAGACVLPGFSFLGNPFFRVVMLSAMGLLAFGADLGGLRRSILFLLLTMAQGGLAVCLDRGGFWGLVLAAGTLCFLCLAGFRGRAGQQQYVPVTICHGGKRISVTALVDTGNTLRDPISGQPVLVVEGAVAEKLLSISSVELARPIETLAMGKAPGMRLISYTAVGQPAGMLLSFRPDSVEICGKTVGYVVAFTPQTLGHGQYQALAGGVL